MQKSINRTLVCLSLCIPLLFGSLLLAGTLDYKSQFLNFIPQLSNAAPCRTGPPLPLRVYMYDLPPRLNVGLLDPNFPDATSVTAQNIPPWRWNDGLRKQHSVEYWMMASLLYEGNDESGSTREAVRVADPDSADVFFVPFFSSLSFNVHVRNMAESNTVDEKLQEGIIRAQLLKMLNGTKDIIYEEAYASEEGFKTSAEHMRSSKFCLHPAGDTPSSCRLFDAIVSHCVPVIVSDRIELPFESEMDYKEFSIFLSVNEVLKPGYLVNELRRVSKEKWINMWLRLKNISHHFEFQYPPKKEDAVNMIWRQVKQKVPAVKLAEHRSRRLKIPDWWR
ncbi:Exostosin family protein [Perilla frutescens var. hirtella]|uniref:Exostosin family protein n=1 Tax=Perilla frutescens var. hirtella TaxID=608512 RepID=A0AAD4P211_PERFH|nr:Exostosin family protein [Perilla frutescens var. hirtella]